jgi:hypothetical protein
MNRHVVRFEIQFTANFLQIPEKFFGNREETAKNEPLEYVRTFRMLLLAAVLLVAS